MDAATVIDALFHNVIGRFLAGALDTYAGEFIVNELGKVTNVKAGPFDPSPWVCINVETGEVGRAYEYNGSYRIQAVESKVYPGAPIEMGEV